MDDTRTKEIVQAIELAWDSLKSHLDGCETVENVPKVCIDNGYGTVDFHRKCVSEYAFIIYTLSKLLNENRKSSRTKRLPKGKKAN